MQTQKLIRVVVYAVLIIFIYLFIKLLSLTSLSSSDDDVDIVEVRQSSKHFPLLAERLVGKIVSKMTHFVSSGTLNLNPVH